MVVIEHWRENARLVGGLLSTVGVCIQDIMSKGIRYHGLEELIAPAVISNHLLPEVEHLLSNIRCTYQSV